jgi:hypothetical protein
MKINNVPTPIIPDPRASRTDGNDPAGANRAGNMPVRNMPARPAAAQPQQPAARTSIAMPASDANVTAPEGTDPKLWSILTSEERSYFAKSAAQGPVTYARVMMGTQEQSLAPSMRGLRLDIRG